MPCQIKNAERDPEVNVDTKPDTGIEPPDGGWGWAVCFAAFMANFTITGMDSSNGIMLLGLLDLFDESVLKTSLVGSIFSGLTTFGGPLVLLLIMCKASHRQLMMVGGITAAASTVASAFAPTIEILIFTYGILAGLSIAINYFSANVVLACYFNKKRALALGIANSGSGIGGFLWCYLVERSISFYGTSGTYLIIGGVYLNLTVYGSLCRPLKAVIKSSHTTPESRRHSEDKKEGVTNLGFTPEDENTENQVEKSTASDQKCIEGNESLPLQTTGVPVSSEKIPSQFADLRSRYCDATIFRNKIFCLLLVIYLLWPGFSLLTYLPAYAESVGLSREEGAMILSIYGIISTLGQILGGFLADVIHIPISYLLASALFGMSFSIVSIPFCRTFATLALTTVVFSICYSFGISLRIVLPAAVLGIEKMPAAYSIMSMLIGVGYTVYPIVSGMVYDATLSFPIIFYMGSAIAFLGAILSCGIIYAQKMGKFV